MEEMEKQATDEVIEIKEMGNGQTEDPETIAPEENIEIVEKTEQEGIVEEQDYFQTEAPKKMWKKIVLIVLRRW